MKRWTHDEIDLLKKYYSTHGLRYCCNLLDRTYKAVGEKARELKIRTNIMNGPKHKGWTKKEENILTKYYPDHGCKYCADLLNRSYRSISDRASMLNLTTIMSPWGAPKKQIIKKLKGNKVIALCKKHGETAHYLQQGKISGCIRCQSSQMKIIHQTAHIKRYYKERWERDKTLPFNLYRLRLRNLLNSAFRRHLQTKGIKKRRGCFRHLSYSPQQLCDHLEEIKEQQKNICPMCRRSYNRVKLSIDHIIPLKTATTELEMLGLFDLKNLSLLCLSCNISKGTQILTPDEIKGRRVQWV